MLLQSMMLISVLMALTLLTLTETVLAVRVDREHAVGGILATLRMNAIEDARVAIAARLANPPDIPVEAAPTPLATILPICTDAQAQCQIHLEETFTETTPTTLAANTINTPAPCPSAAADEMLMCNMQTGGNLQEGRRLVNVSLSLTNSLGENIGTTSQSVLLRTFALPPYAVVISVAEPGTMSGLTQPGDTAGMTPVTSGTGSSTNDTLLRSYAPCRELTTSNPAYADGAAWSNWQGDNSAPVQAACFPNSGDSSRFADAAAAAPTPADEWSR